MDKPPLIRIFFDTNLDYSSGHLSRVRAHLVGMLTGPI